ncbi:uncharacterized protein LOC109827502 isoform X2 [Asparagus officinalis]|uniref:uncharacterized protein LOC109827502 isoform X2 n=1 Tax=Asparagus officinalis TaxID=4686 RepID=UPI00098E350B|nr:uncharacterized protein LOC109827502 isoform X2 [Asparagus officinalis]
MAIITNAAIFPSLKLSNRAPPSSQSSMLFKPIGSYLQQSILITSKSFSQQPNSVNPLFNPILGSHEGSMSLKPMSSNPEKSILITSKSFSQHQPISVNPLFNPILDAHGDVMRAIPNLGTFASDQPLFNPSGEDFNLNGEDQEDVILNLFVPDILSAKGNLSAAISEKANLLWQIYQRMNIQNQINGEAISFIDAHEGYLNGWRNKYGRGKWLVLLLEDPSHTEELVSTTIPAIFPYLTAWNARILLEISRQQGYAVVIVAARLEHAVVYVQEMRGYGLRADFVQSKK